MDIRNNSVLITGGASGIGLALARAHIHVQHARIFRAGVRLTPQTLFRWLNDTVEEAAQAQAQAQLGGEVRHAHP